MEYESIVALQFNAGTRRFVFAACDYADFNQMHACTFEARLRISNFSFYQSGKDLCDACRFSTIPWSLFVAFLSVFVKVSVMVEKRLGQKVSYMHEMHVHSSSQR